MSRPAAALAALISSVLLGLSASACGLEQDVAQRAGSGAGVGRAAPALQGTLLDGSHFDGSALRGHVAVVDFWGSWCVPCREQQNDLDALAARYAPRGVVFTGVVMRDDRAAARAYVAHYGVPYPSLFDDGGGLASAWDVAAPPTTVVVDRGGVVRARLLGGLSQANLPALLDRLLG